MAEQKYGYIYKVTNKVNGKSYIGQTTQFPVCLRWEQHVKDAYYNYKKFKEGKAKQPVLFQVALHKYGETNFQWDIIDSADTQDELDFKEVFYIDAFDTFGEKGYNMTNGGTLITHDAINFKLRAKQEYPIIVYRKNKNNFTFLGVAENLLEVATITGLSPICTLKAFKGNGNYKNFYFEYEMGNMALFQ